MITVTIPRRCCICLGFLSPVQQAQPGIRTCGSPSCRKAHTRRMASVPQYQPPLPGAEDSADPHFPGAFKAMRHSDLFAPRSPLPRRSDTTARFAGVHRCGNVPKCGHTQRHHDPKRKRS